MSFILFRGYGDTPDFEALRVPVLLQILRGTANPIDLLPEGSVYGLPGNSSIELSLPGGFPVSAGGPVVEWRLLTSC